MRSNPSDKAKRGHDGLTKLKVTMIEHSYGTEMFLKVLRIGDPVNGIETILKEI